MKKILVGTLGLAVALCIMSFVPVRIAAQGGGGRKDA